MAKLPEESEQQKFTADDIRPGGNRSGFAAQQLYSYVERLERLEEERSGTVEDMKEARAEAKGVGFDTKILGQVIRRRKMDAGTRQEADAVLELYEEAVRQEEKAAYDESMKGAE